MKARNLKMNYTLSDFDYNLPEELIAQEPAQPRDHARLLVYNRSNKTIRDDRFYNLTDYLPQPTTLVVNNSRVEKCRLLFDEGSKEIFVLKAVNDRTVRALVRPGKRFRKGRTVELTPDLSAEVTAVDGEGIRTLRLSTPLSDPVYNDFKHTPFPPYIQQNEELSDEYQTVYAKDPGSKAAPTAGLHFTDSLLADIASHGIKKAEVTLHVGLGTFAPVKADKIEDHIMHSEQYEVDASTITRLNEARHLTAVGTTSVRVLESCVQEERLFAEGRGSTNIFIRPGYRFRAVDALITNFHLPKSTLLMLVAAFMGYDEMRRLYEHAVKERYRFYSFGDAMLIL